MSLPSLFERAAFASCRAWPFPHLYSVLGVVCLGERSVSVDESMTIEAGASEFTIMQFVSLGNTHTNTGSQPAC